MVSPFTGALCVTGFILIMCGVAALFVGTEVKSARRRWYLGAGMFIVVGVAFVIGAIWVEAFTLAA